MKKQSRVITKLGVGIVVYSEPENKKYGIKLIDPIDIKNKNKVFPFFENEIKGV